MKYFIGIKIFLVLNVLIAWQTVHEKISLNEVLSVGSLGAAEDPSLKKIFKNDFFIGTALSAFQIEEKDVSIF